MSLLSACDGQPIPKAIYELLKPQDDTPIQNTKGFNSDTIIIGDRVVVKIIGRKRRLPHDLQARANIGRMIDSLHKGLRDISPDLVPKYSNWALMPAGADESTEMLLLVFSPYMGIDLEEAMRAGILSPQDATRLVTDFFQQVFTTLGRNKRCEFGIDPKPANFVFHPEKNNAVFIDLIPPRLKDESGKYWLELEDVKNPDALQHGIWKYYTPLGMCFNLLTRLCSISPNCINTFADELILWLGKEKLDAFRDEFEDTLEHCLEEQFVEKCAYPLLLRVTACKLAAEKSSFQSKLDLFFSQYTHYEDGDIQPVLDSAKNFLLSELSI